MSLLIQNITGGNVTINDLGLELVAGEIYDLTTDEAADVVSSASPTGDLYNGIVTTGDLVVFDPLDNTTILSASGSPSDAIECLRSHNDPHYRIRGGELDQLDDVTFTGSPAVPNTNDILQYNGSIWENVPASTLGTTVDRVQHIHVGKHGSDANDGLNDENAKLTFTSAIAAAATGSPVATRYTIWCEDSGTYTESFTVPSGVSVEARDATVSGTVTLNDNSELTIREVVAATNDSAVIKSSGSGSARINAEILRSTGTGDTVTTQSGETGVLLCYARQVFTEDGGGIVDNSTAPTGHIHIEIEDLYVTGTGSGLDRSSSTGLIVGRVAHILEIGGGVGVGTAISISSGRVDVVAGFINTTTAFSVTAAGTLNLIANLVNGARVQTSGLATVDVLEANVLRWTTITVADSPFVPRRIGFVSVDTTSGPVQVDLPYPPSDGDNVSFQDARDNFGTNAATITGNGAEIENGGSPSQVVLNVDGTSGIFIYNASISAWTFTRIQEEVAASPENLIYVTKNGDDVIGTGSFSNPFLTIKRGVQEALLRASGSPQSPVTVKVLDGVYDEINPINITGTGSEFVQVQGSHEFAVIVRPTVDTTHLFSLTSNAVGDGPSLNRMTIDASNNSTFKSNNEAAVLVSGPGRMVVDKVNINGCGIGIDGGNGTSAQQEVVYDFGTISNCTTGIDAKGDGIQVLQVAFLRGNDTGLSASENVRVEIGNFSIQGSDVGGSPTSSGLGISMNDSAVLVGTSGTITNLETGLEGNDTSTTTLITTSFENNTTEFNQVDATARIGIQGFLSKTKQLISDGSIVSLNYIDTGSSDFIVGNADATGDPGLEFRVRDFDGRVFIGDNAENYNAPTNTVGGSRTVNLIDTNGNFRVWRWQATPGLHPAFEWVKGVNTFIADDEGDAPILSATAGTNSIVIDLSGADYNDPLNPGFKGSDRTTLDTRIFYPGAEIRINGTAYDGDYVVASSTYTGGSPDAETITVTFTGSPTVITSGAGGTAVFGGGAGRPDGVSTYVDDPTSAISAGVGDVHWDMLLRETDSFVIRRRTGGAGKEHVRIFRDRTEFQHGPAYSGSDNNLVLVVEGTGGVNYLTINNNTGGPEIAVASSGSPTAGDVDINMIPSGTGTVLVPPGYEANITDNSLITKQYFDDQIGMGGSPFGPDTAAVLQVRRTTNLGPDVPVTPSWGDVTWDTTDVETDAAVIEHNNTNTEEIDIKEDGLYMMQYVFNVDDEVTGRVLVNGSTVVDGSLHSTGDTTDTNQVISQNSPTFYSDLTAGDTLVVQVQAQTTAEFIIADLLFTIEKVGAVGAQGPIGPAGSGTTINVKEDNVLVTGTPFEVLNFQGMDAVQHGGSPTDQVNVRNVFGSYSTVATSPGVSTTTSTTFQNKVTLNTTTVPAGTYRVAFSYGWNHDDTGTDFEANFIGDASALGEIHKQEPKDSAGTFSTTGTSQRHYIQRVFYETYGSAGTHSYTLQYRTDTGGAESSVWDVIIEFWRVS